MSSDGSDWARSSASAVPDSSARSGRAPPPRLVPALCLRSPASAFSDVSDSSTRPGQALPPRLVLTLCLRDPSAVQPASETPEIKPRSSGSRSSVASSVADSLDRDMRGLGSSGTSRRLPQALAWLAPELAKTLVSETKDRDLRGPEFRPFSMTSVTSDVIDSSKRQAPLVPALRRHDSASERRLGSSVPDSRMEGSAFGPGSRAPPGLPLSPR
mmetsp:Transcript_72656/g.201495  ORF Transcript_72656/g.201495 Transcript_72656/m.201495 type:complete len:214 (-) Transcript_72656:374-1015(-)